MLKQDIIICADDFGYDDEVCEGILSLARAGKIHAISVLTDADSLAKYLDQLNQLPDTIQLGLHLNLTETFANNNKSWRLLRLMTTLLLRPSTKQQINQTIATQLNQFEAIFNRPPDFIDGHQHVQVFFAIRRIFLQNASRQYTYLKSKPWIRQVATPLTMFSNTDSVIKLMLLNVLNLGFKNICHKKGFSTNRYFLGVYSLTSTDKYPKLLNIWLNNNKTGALLMCHPAKQLHSQVKDQARYNEYSSLSKQD